jgi:metabolite-proton symporter
VVAHVRTPARHSARPARLDEEIAMSTGTTAPAGVPMRRIALAGFAGTTIEFYDFFIYGTAAALVFGKVFFPALGSVAGTVASFATFAVAFIARPLGSLIFGHIGDRIGRKRTLVTTLLLMGISTFAIGLLPGAGTIGALAPVLLVLLRLLQGIGLGGEWAGAALLVAEYAPPGKRGRYGMFPQFGPGIAFGLASATFLLTGLTMSDAVFLAWGWRIPFLLSIVLVLIGLFVRLRIEETPVFRRALEANDRAAAPVAEVFRHESRTILLAGGSLTALFGLFYVGTVYVTSYATAVLGHSRTTVLTIGVVTAAGFAAANALSAVLSDRYGRRSLLMVGNVAAAVWGLVLFPVIDSGSVVMLGTGLVVTLAIVGFCYGPAGAYLPELFPTRYRYSAAGVAYACAGLLGGAVPPLVATPLYAAGGGLAIGAFLGALGVLSVLATVFLSETRARSLEPATV